MTASCSSPRRGPAGPGVLYHNMLVSPRLGGAEQLAIEIHKRAEAARPGRSELLVPENGAARDAAQAGGLRFRTFGFDSLMNGGRLASLGANLGMLGSLGRAAGTLLHVHSPFVYGALRPYLAVSAVRTVLHLHLDYSVEQLKWALKRPPDVIITCARFMIERVERALAATGASRTKIVPVINAVDVERFVPGDRVQARRDLHVSTEMPVALMAANLSPHKGQETAIRAVASLAAHGTRTELWLVGEDRENTGYSAHLRQLADTLGAGDLVKLMGFRRDMPRLLHAANCLLLPSTSEGLPLSILEAQASKVVVLAAPTAGIPEIIDNGRTGYLIGAQDAEGYANALALVLSNAGIAQSVSEAAYQQVISQFSLKPYSEKIFAEYDALLEAA